MENVATLFHLLIKYCYKWGHFLLQPQAHCLQPQECHGGCSVIVFLALWIVLSAAI